MIKLPERPRKPLARKLERFIPLTAHDYEALERLDRADQHFKAGQDISVEGKPPPSVFILVEGMAFRYRTLADGRRQIMTFLLPGDLCDLHSFLVKKMDHSVASLTPVHLAAIPREEILEMGIRYPRISVALWWSSMQEEAMLRERIVALGRRNAAARIAYILCELVWRNRAIGRADHNCIDLPLTQTELADTLGLTPVHVTRVLQSMRRDKLLILEHRQLTLLDIDRLACVAQFNKDYLHLGAAPEEIRRYFDQATNHPSGY